MDPIERVEIRGWGDTIPAEMADQAVAALEAGKILLMPNLRFALSHAELRFRSPELLSRGSKNVSFDLKTGALGGTSCGGSDESALSQIMSRFAQQAAALITALCPHYADRWIEGRTSFRPAEISGRVTSWRKDDTRLHVDAFPSRPIGGNRILRVFANVNASEPRQWRAGEAFEKVAVRFLPSLRPPLPGSLATLHLLRVTKTRRTLYDHYMLGIHDAMKADLQYQKESPQADISFAAGAVWACFTDLVSHAAMSGQHAFEQTFYLPVKSMRDPSQSPLRVLEKLMQQPLV